MNLKTKKYVSTKTIQMWIPWHSLKLQRRKSEHSICDHYGNRCFLSSIRFPKRGLEGYACEGRTGALEILASDRDIFCCWNFPKRNKALVSWRWKRFYMSGLIVGAKVGCIHAAPRQGPPAPRSQGVISASVVVAPGQIFYATIIQKPCV